MFKPLGTFFDLSISYLPTSEFKLAKSDFLGKSDRSTPVDIFKLDFF